MPARNALAQILATLVRLSASDGGPAPKPSPKPSGLPFNEAIGWHRRRDPALKDDAWAELQNDARRRAFTVANVAQLDLVVEVQKTIDRAIADGTTFADFKKEIGPKLIEHWQGSVKNPAARLETIFRTNVQAAYGAGRYERALEVADTRPYWRFDGVADIRQSGICRPLNGTIRRHDDPWWQTRIPPLHFQCRSRIATLTEKQAERAGITADDKLPTEAAQEGFGQPPARRDEVLDEVAAKKVNAAPAPIADVARAKLATPPPPAPPRDGGGDDSSGRRGPPMRSEWGEGRPPEREPSRPAWWMEWEGRAPGQLDEAPPDRVIDSSHRTVERLLAQGNDIRARARMETDGVKNPDIEVNPGREGVDHIVELTEVLTPRATFRTISNRVEKKRHLAQARSLVIDCTDTDLSEADVLLGMQDAVRRRRATRERFDFIRLMGRLFDLTFWDFP